MKNQDRQIFVVDIKARENASWQGTIEWVKTRETVPFRSVLEMLDVMESAIKVKEE